MLLFVSFFPENLTIGQKVKKIRGNDFVLTMHSL